MEKPKRVAIRRVLPPANPPDSTTKRKIREAVRKVVAASRIDPTPSVGDHGSGPVNRSRADGRAKHK